MDSRGGCAITKPPSAFTLMTPSGLVILILKGFSSTKGSLSAERDLSLMRQGEETWISQAQRLMVSTCLSQMLLFLAMYLLNRRHLATA